MSGFKLLEKPELEKKIVETINDRDYIQFVDAMERLANMPYSYRVKDFILEYRRPLISQTTTFDAPKPKYDEDGRAFVTTYGNTVYSSLIV